jgi:tripeptidyl-peptidase-1
MLTSLPLTALFAAFALASPLRIRSPYAVKETHEVPPKWKVVDDAPANHVIKLQIGLKQSQFDELERHLYEGISSRCDLLLSIVLTMNSLRSTT